MKLFTATFDGHYLGGRAYVLTASLEEARAQIIEEGLRAGIERALITSTLEIEEIPLDEPYIWLDNGDY